MVDYSSRYLKFLELHWLIYVVLAVLLAAVGIYDLRQNNLEMANYKAAVINADEAGEDINTALHELGSYVFQNMNTSTQVTLANQYSRDAQAVIEASQPDDIGQEVYRQARVECENPNIPLTARASCVAEYVSANGPDVINPEDIKLPPESSYQYSFVAPTWSADLAGISLLLAVVSAGFAAYSWTRDAR